MKTSFKAWLAILGLGVSVITWGAWVISPVLAASGPQPGVNSPYNPVWTIPIDSIKNTYRSSVRQLSPIAGAPSGGLVQICGGSGVVTRVTKVIVGGRATAVQAVDWLVSKRSTAGSLSNTVVGVPLDASVGAADAAVTYGIAASGSLGTLVGYIAGVQQFLGNLTTGLGGPTTEITFGHGPGSGVILRSAAQCLAIGLSQASVGGNLLNVDLEWTEE